MVDSRAYRFAFLVHKPSDIPADFRRRANLGDFDLGLFLPQDHADRFAKPKFIPHLFLLQDGALRVLPHPEYKKKPDSITLSDMIALERGQFLLSAWLSIWTQSLYLSFPYPRREEIPVQVFLSRIVEKLPQYALQCEPVTIPAHHSTHKGIMEAAADECTDDEPFVAHWMTSVVGRRFDFVGITNRRLLWFTNSNDSGEIEAFGYRVLYSPIQHVGTLRTEAEMLRICLPNTDWQVPLSSQKDLVSAGKFAHVSKQFIDSALPRSEAS